MDQIILMKKTLKILSIFLIGFLAFSHIATAAIALDTTGNGTGITSPLSWTHVAAANSYLAVCITNVNGTTTAVTWNGSESMNLVRTDQQNFSTQRVESTLWFLHNPTSGSHSVSATITVGSTPGFGGHSVSYTGAGSSDSAEAVGGTSATSAGDKTFTVTTVSNNSWVFACGINDGISPTITADQTQRTSNAPSSAAVAKTSDTNAAVTPAGNQTMGFTIAGTFIQGFAASGAAIAPAASVATAAPAGHFTNSPTFLNARMFSN